MNRVTIQYIALISLEVQLLIISLVFKYEDGMKKHLPWLWNIIFEEVDEDE